MMKRARYRESRTLVRRLCRLPVEDRNAFKAKVARLREHFEQFNLDTADLCQWIMGLRKEYVKSHANRSDAASFGALGDFLLEPTLEGVETDEKTRDRRRLHVFDDVAGYRPVKTLDDGGQVPEWLREAMDAAAAARPHQGSKNANARKLFERLRDLEAQHRLVLLKSAAEWIVARYQRGVENWQRGHKQWEDEKCDWEQQHPKLTPEIREKYTNIFKQLKDPERDDKPGLRKKNPRICPYERLKQNIDNCCYAGRMGHGPLCWKYVEFVKAHKGKDKRFNDTVFFDVASDLAGLCREHNVTNPANALNNQHILDQLFAKDQQRKQEKSKNKKKQGPPKKGDPQKQKAAFVRIFKANWNAYLKAMGDPKTGATLNGQTAIEKGCLPHCQKIRGKVFEESDCVWNKHTNYCLEYKRALLTNPANGIDDGTLALEGTYRDWRKDFLAGPRKPQFRYPSARDLPMPKVFGNGFHEIDFDRSILRLRLDDMREGEWIEFGFTPWPRKYSPSRDQIKDRVTSVHVNFIGSRARIGFRFDVEHRQSRFTSNGGCSQDKLDDLRSKEFPRQAQDQKFIDAARKCLFDTFDGDPEKDLRILAVDMGMGGAHAAVYEGGQHKRDIAIPIIKINKSYTDLPSQLEKDPKDRKMRGPVEMAIDPDDPKKKRIIDPRGLRKEHVGRHLSRISEGAAKVVEKRRQDNDNPVQTLHESDFRGLKRHIRWMIRDWARLNAKQIIEIAEKHKCHVIVFESLRGSRRPDYDKLGDDAERQKAERILYAYGQVRRKVTEKAVERGMRTVTAPYHKSSQVCHACGKAQDNHGLWRKNKTQKKFICEHCKTETDSDANAARVIACVFWAEITLPDPRQNSRRG